VAADALAAIALADEHLVRIVELFSALARDVRSAEQRPRNLLAGLGCALPSAAPCSWSTVASTLRQQLGLDRKDRERIRAAVRRSQRTVRRIELDSGCSAAELLAGEARIDIARRRIESARTDLVAANQRLVFHFARKFVGRGVPLMELVQEGNIGLLRALDKYDPARGFKLGTYASWWIRQAMARAVANQGRAIRTPVHAAEKIGKWKRTRQYLSTRLGREATAEEVADRLGVDPVKTRNLLLASRRLLSLDAPVTDESALCLGDRVAATGAPSPLEGATALRLAADVRDALAVLRPRERAVVSMRFGIGTDEPEHTLEEVGQKLGVTRERARQIEAIALRKLRVASETQRLRSYAER
jgi:RNA polymerase primary sigma factor